MELPPLTSRRRWLLVVALAVLCLSHLAFGLWLLPQGMFPKYVDAAARLKAGTLGAEMGADYSPLYLLLHGEFSAPAVRWLQSLLGSAAILFVYLAGSRIFGRIAGLIAAVLLAFSGPFLLYEATFEPDLLIAVLEAGALALLLWEPARIRVERRYMAAGALLGLATAARPAGLPALFAAALWVLWQHRGEARAFRRFAPAGALLGIGLLTAVAPPFLVRIRAGSKVTATMSAGLVIHMGNRPEGTGLGGQLPFLLMLQERQERRYAIHDLHRRFARVAEGRELSAPQSEAYWLRRVAAFLQEHPAAFAKLWAKKLAFFILGPDAHDLIEVRRAQARLQALPLLWLGATGILGLAGLLLSTRCRKGAGLLALQLSSYAFVALIIYVLTRYRLSVLPILCVLGGHALAAVFSALRSPRQLLLPVIVLLGAFSARLAFPAITEAARLQERVLVASGLGGELDVALEGAQLERATELFTQVQAAQPFTTLTRALRGIAFESPRLAEASGRLSAEQFGDSHRVDEFMLAELAARAGRCDLALASAKNLARSGYRSSIFDRSLDPGLLAARCLLERQEPDEAFLEVSDSLARHPGTLDGLSMAVASGKAGDGKRAELFLLHDPLSARYALSRSFLDWGRPKEALAETDAALEALPESGLLQYERARALALLGRHDEAAVAYARALTLFPAHAFPTLPLDGTIRRMDEIHSGTPEDLWLSVEHELRAGRLAQAEQKLQKAPPELLKSPRVSEQRAFLSKARGAGR